MHHPLRLPRRHNQGLPKSLPEASPPNALETPDLENLLFNDFFNKAIHTAQQPWRDVVAEATRLGIPCPAFSTALSFFDGYRTKRLPAALLQAQRDYFGAHTFRVLPQYVSKELPEGKDIHINWVWQREEGRGLMVDWEGRERFCLEL
jgi:6-phosphogluconate dehydrogenase